MRLGPSGRLRPMCCTAPVLEHWSIVHFFRSDFFFQKFRCVRNGKYWMHQTAEQWMMNQPRFRVKFRRFMIDLEYLYASWTSSTQSALHISWVHTAGLSVPLFKYYKLWVWSFMWTKIGPKMIHTNLNTDQSGAVYLEGPMTLWCLRHDQWSCEYTQQTGPAGQCVVEWSLEKYLDAMESYLVVTTNLLASNIL